LVVYVDNQEGYQLLVPSVWAQDSRRVPYGGRPLRGVIRFGWGSGFGTRSQPALTISIGRPNGSIFLCQPFCERHRVSSLDELEAALTSRFVQGGDQSPAEISGRVRLGGHIGRFERPGYGFGEGLDSPWGLEALSGPGTCLGCPDMRYHAFTLHNGRPVVLAFDYWNIAFRRIATDAVAKMLASFQMDSEPRPMIDPQTGLRVGKDNR
jgi:hypothetical protein